MSASKDEAINLLSLDGGGVRGVASLLILHEIMIRIKEIRRLEKIPKPCEYFHMIAGTSTGGLIAIMLGRLRMSTAEALQEYDQCAKKIFSSQNKKWTTLTEKYRASALKEAVEDLVRRRGMGEHLLDPDAEHSSKGQCFVCVMPASEVGEPRRLASFNTADKKPGHDIKIWEAARATTAASYFFKPMTIKISKRLTEDYIDAAIGCNNPVEYLLVEAADRIGTGRRLGCLISIGTGTRPIKIERASTGLRNLAHVPKFAKELLGTLKNTATGAEDAHRRVQAKFEDYPNAYFRFNVPDAADQVGLDKYRKIKDLKATTAAYLSEPLVAAQVLHTAKLLARNASEHGLTLGHVYGLDKDQVILSTQEAQPLGDISRFFMARDDILDKLDACFPPRDTRGKPRREFLLYGLGGVGKTQVALKAADKFEDRFQYVFHIDGTATATVNQSYAKICQQHCEGYRQGGSMARGTIEEMKELALRWIEGLAEEWLMIYDNHPEKDRLQPVLPRRNTGNIIYTCRSQGPAADLPAECSCEVKPFAEDDAVKLLLRVAGREHSGSESDEEEMRSAQKMVAEVGYLPLAIDSIGAYLRNGDCSAITYLQRFRDRRIRSGLFSSAQNKDGSLPARPGLYTALDLSYDAIAGVRRREGSSAVGMAAACALRALNLLCFYHNEEIPFSMIGRAAEQRLSFGANGMYPIEDLADDPFMDVSYLLDCHIPEGTWDSLAFRLGVQMLQQFSLVKLSPTRNTISMHVLVQTWARDRMDDKTRGRQALAARIVLIESIKLGWNRFDQVLSRNLTPHFDACMPHEHEEITMDEYQAHLDFKLGWFYKEDKQFSRAVESLEDAVRMWKASTGAHSSSTTVGLSVLANVYHDMGRLGDAEATYLEVLDRLWIRNYLTVDERKARRAREERRLRRQALSQQLARLTALSSPESKGEKAGGRMSLDKAAMAEEGEGSLPPARSGSLGADETGTDLVAQWQQDVLAVIDNEPQQETLKDWQHEMAAVYADLARLFFDEGRHELGRWCLSQAIERAKSDGSYDMEIRTWEDELKQNSGVVDLDYWNRRIAAVDDFSREDRDVYLGHDYSFVLPIGFASALLEKDNWETAYKIYEGTFRRAPRFYGPGDRKTLDLMRLMAFCQTQRGLVEEAEELARTAVERSKASYGRWHFQTAKCLKVLAYVLARTSLDAGEESEWRKATQEAYEAMRFAFGEEHDETKELKRSLDALGGDAPDRELAGEGDRLFAEIFARVLAKGVPKSMEEYEERADKEYRELWIERCRAESAMKEDGGRHRARQEGTEGGSGPSAGDNRESSSAVSGNERPRVSRRKDKWQSKGKANISLSPIQETESGFEEPTQGVGVAETVPEYSETCSSGGRWRLLHEFKLGADWKTPGKPCIHIWKSTGSDGALMFTGAIVGDGKPRWRRLRPWDDFQTLLKPPTTVAGNGDA